MLRIALVALVACSSAPPRPREADDRREGAQLVAWRKDYAVARGALDGAHDEVDWYRIDVPSRPGKLFVAFRRSRGADLKVLFVGPRGLLSPKLVLKARGPRLRAVFEIDPVPSTVYARVSSNGEADTYELSFTLEVPPPPDLEPPKRRPPPPPQEEDPRPPDRLPCSVTGAGPRFPHCANLPPPPPPPPPPVDLRIVRKRIVDNRVQITCAGGAKHGITLAWTPRLYDKPNEPSSVGDGKVLLIDPDHVEVTFPETFGRIQKYRHVRFFPPSPE